MSQTFCRRWEAYKAFLANVAGDEDRGVRGDVIAIAKDYRSGYVLAANFYQR